LRQCNAKVKKFNQTNVYSSIKKFKSHHASDTKWAVAEGEALSSLSINKDILYEAPYYLTPKKKEVGLSHLFYVRLKKSEDISLLEKMALDNNVEILGSYIYTPLKYTLACTKESKGNSLQMANKFYESGFFAVSEPDLMSSVSMDCTNDTYFYNQWALMNTGQRGFPAGVDIRYCQAREITTGNPNIIVAVVDRGVELDHPDLTNMYPLSYDTETGKFESVVYDPHGTACAGIIGANSNNELGVSGIAPNCPLMSISNKFAPAGPADLQKIAAGIEFAREKGASVISCSWGDIAQNDDIDVAITRALTQGRGGLGCVVVFSAGNFIVYISTDDDIHYPANSNDEIIVVGALNPCGERKSPSSCDNEYSWGSHYGEKLDVVAPGVFIPTTDRQGLNAYNEQIDTAGNYYQYFRGTSAACAHVAGIAALILSENPNLTNMQVSDIIETTAQKVGGYNYKYYGIRPNGKWNNEMGYGLVDAYAAVSNAKCPPSNYFTHFVYNYETKTGCNVNVENVKVFKGGNLTISSQNATIINGQFEVELGGYFEVIKK
jgi:subtilisin family serine protease